MTRIRSLEILKVATCFVASIFSFFCFKNQYSAADTCDAYCYIEIGKLFAAHGIVNHAWSDLRLYGYPLFLAGIFKIAAIFDIPALPAIAVVQVLLYFVSVYAFDKLISEKLNERLGNIVFFSLISNVFIYPYLILPLTDGLSIILLLTTICIFLSLFSNLTRPNISLRQSAVSFFLLGCITCFAVMVRPGSIYQVGVVFVFALILMITATNKKLAFSLTAFITFAFGFYLIAAPQIIFNYTIYKSLSFLPYTDLHSLQIEVGKQMIKYATYLGGGPPRISYLNPWLTHNIPGMSWYLHNPTSGIKTIFLHVYSALDFDYLYCYIYNLKPSYRIWLFLFSETIVFWGIVGYFGLTQKILREKIYKKNLWATIASTCLIVLVPTLLWGWLCIYGVSEVENRYALPIVTELLPLAAWALMIYLRQSRHKILLAVSFLTYLILAWKLSCFVESLIVLK